MLKIFSQPINDICAYVLYLMQILLTSERLDGLVLLLVPKQPSSCRKDSSRVGVLMVLQFLFQRMNLSSPRTNLSFEPSS